MWCCCRPRKITEALDECILNLKADPTIYKDVDSYCESDLEDNTEIVEEFRAIPTLIVHVYDNTKELNFKEPIPVYVRNMITQSVEDFMRGFFITPNVICLATFGTEEKYGFVDCVKESRDENNTKIYVSTPFPTEYIDFLLSNVITITVNEEGLNYDFKFTPYINTSNK